MYKIYKDVLVSIRTIRLAQLILKRKFPSIDKPLQKYAPQKGPSKNISPGAYFRNFTVLLIIITITVIINTFLYGAFTKLRAPYNDLQAEDKVIIPI